MRNFFIIFGLLVTCSIVVVVSFSGVKQYNRISAIDREIAALEQEVSVLERENALLEDRVDYFSSDVYKEHVAKERLGYRKKGEQVVVVVQSPQKNAPQQERIEEIFGTSTSPQTWWQRLFGQ